MFSKTVFTLTLTLLSFQVWSCPELEGTYRCRVNGRLTDTIITQDKRDDVWTFKVQNEKNELDLIADGNNYSVNDLGEIRNANYSASCSNVKLTVNASGDVYSGSRRVGRGNSVLEFSIQPNTNNLIAKTTISMGSFRLPPETLNCPKL